MLLITAAFLAFRVATRVIPNRPAPTHVPCEYMENLGSAGATLYPYGCRLYLTSDPKRLYFTAELKDGGQ
jgi:hypothetical protein